MTTRTTLRESDFATIKQVIEVVGPCAVAIEGLDERLARLERAMLTPTITPYTPDATG